MAKKLARKAKAKGAKNLGAKKLPATKGRFYEDPKLVRSSRDPNFKSKS